MPAFTRRAWLAALAGRLAAQERPTFSADVRVVSLFATVTNKRGEIVRDLGKDDFLLEEDGRPQLIRYFSRESDLALTLGLMVDTSMSQRRVLEQERQASHRFFRQVLRPGKDLAFVLHFDHEVELLQDLTADRAKLEKALDLLRVPAPNMARRPSGGGRVTGTALYDSVVLASDELMRKQAGRKALVMLSDGVDAGSKLPISAAIEAAQRADTLAYSVLFSDRESYNRPVRMGGRGRPGGGRRPGPMRNMPDGKKVLERLARETGGGFFEVTKKQSIEAVYERIQEELRNQYSLGYASDRPGAPGYRKIRLATKKGLIVRTREGYYAG